MKTKKISCVKDFLKYLVPHKKSLICVFLLMICGQACGLYLPSLMANIVDVGIRRGGARTAAEAAQVLSQAELLARQTSYILRTGTIMIAVTLLSVIFMIISNRITSKMSAKISSDLREEVFKKVLRLSHPDVCDLSVSSLITRCTGDVESVKGLLFMLVEVFIPPAIMVGALTMAIARSPAMSPTIVVGAVIAVLVVTVCFKLTMPKIKLIQALTDKFNLIVSERLTGVIPIRVFDNEELEQKRFDTASRELCDISLFVSRITSFMVPILTISMNVISIAIMWMGAHEISRLSMNVGDVMAFVQYTMMVISAFLMLSVMISMIPRAWISVERVFEVLNKPDEVVIRNGKKLGNENISIEFKNVDFKYSTADDNVLRSINFCAHSGQTIGIIGTTGSGKSTFVKLIMGFYKATSGDVLINGIPIDEIDSKELKSSIGYVPQNGTLFSGTLASNMRLGKENIPDNKIYEALDTAQMKIFTEKNGLDFKVEEGGKNLSGGQCQRIAIARALTRNARIYIFDDSFSKLDFRTDFNLRKALSQKVKDTLVFIVSQRIGTIKSADNILVLDKGGVAGFDTHENLIKNCDVYRETVKLQTAGGEQ